MHYTEIFPQELLDEMLQKRYVGEQFHPELPLKVLNYTHQCQYDSAWNACTLNCRGLVVHTETGEIVGRGFPKFFNMEDPDDVHFYGPINWSEQHVVLEKMDGVWFGVTRFAGQLVTWTRGSFTSWQSDIGRQMLADIDLRGFDELLDETTVCFEIIHPETKIVVDYRGRKELTFLDIIEKDGTTIPFIQVQRLARYLRTPSARVFAQVRSIPDGEEGFVVRFDSGRRTKVKGDWYKQRHAFLMHLSSRRIWQHLVAGTLNEVIDACPDEFMPWVKQEVETLTKEHVDTLMRAHHGLEVVLKNLPEERTRKDIALAWQAHGGNNYVPSGLFFGLLDGRDVTSYVWELVKPEFRKPTSTINLEA